METANLVIDIGNTRMKAALFGGGIMLDYANLEHSDKESVEALIGGRDVGRAILSSTAVVDAGLEEWLARRFDYIRLNHETPTPMRSVYHTPKTLGRDRIAGVVGAMELFPGRGCLVVDAGTCITYDMVNAHGVYLGGNISPGISMRLQAMDEFTAALPTVEKQLPGTDKGHSTHSAMNVGAVWGAALEARGFIQRFALQSDDLAVILTGGDAPMINQLLDGAYYEAPGLVLAGLNKILTHNA